MGPVLLRRAAERACTEHPGGRAQHCFSFGRHYDPANTHCGVLVAVNDEHLHAGGGYPRHPHRGSEVVTVVVSGTLAHTDSAGNRLLLGPGSVARFDPGAGADHSETAHDGPVRFVQSWLAPTPDPGLPDVAWSRLPPGRFPLVVVAAAPGRYRGPDVVPLRSDAALLVARPAVGDTLVLPDAPHRHLFVTRGTVELAGTEVLTSGDSAALGADGTGGRVRLTARDDAEVLLWEMHEDLTAP